MDGSGVEVSTWILILMKYICTNFISFIFFFIYKLNVELRQLHILIPNEHYRLSLVLILLAIMAYIMWLSFGHSLRIRERKTLKIHHLYSDNGFKVSSKIRLKIKTHARDI